MKVLLVDDEKSIRLTLGDALEDAGHRVQRCDSFAQGRAALGESKFDCVITDLQLPDGIGLELLPLAREKSPNAALLVITAHQSIDTAIKATKSGADYLIKPFLNEEVIAKLQKIEELQKLRAEVAELKTQVIGRSKLGGIVGSTQKMQELFRIIETIGPSDVTVLIRGESGTGKELVAEALHAKSARASKRLIKLSCAAIPENLLEDELFGHEKGAFTDAKDRKPGRFELADGGTIFLDDIDDMSIQTQVKLLRVLQEREFERIGGTKTVKIDVRVITATKVDLSLLVRQGRFRDDLYFRLRVLEVNLPSLRERAADVPMLVRHFISSHGAAGRKFDVSPETLQRMMQYAWPGNVRELENAVLRALAMAGQTDRLDEKYLLQTPSAMQPGADSVSVPVIGGTMMSPERSVHSRSAESGRMRVSGGSGESGRMRMGGTPREDLSSCRPLRMVVEDAERAYILKVLTLTGGNRTKAAEVLDISRKNLWEKMKDLGISDEK